MPLPLFLGVGAAIAAVAGVGSAAHGAKKMKDANDTMKTAERRHKENLSRFERQNVKTNSEMDSLGELELTILKGFETFANTFEKIQNRPIFKAYNSDDIHIPEYDGEELKRVSIGAGVLLGGAGGAALGTVGGFAAAGATTAAVMALGTASTGTAIASLSGIAATNATLAALGGGALAAGGGGIALGTTVLGAATLGVGLLVGGVIFNIAGSSISSKADEAWAQMKRAEAEIDKICNYMKRLTKAAKDYKSSLLNVNAQYETHLRKMQQIIEKEGRTDWNTYTPAEKLLIENTVLLVGLLYNMCKVELVKKSQDKNGMNSVNTKAIEKSMADAKALTDEVIEKEAHIA